MPRKTIKEKLAELIEKELQCVCYPDSLRVNRGANQFNDWCSWTGKISGGDTQFGQICSWNSMGKLVKKGTIRIINKETGELA